MRERCAPNEAEEPLWWLLLLSLVMTKKRIKTKRNKTKKKTKMKKTKRREKRRRWRCTYNICNNVTFGMGAL